VIRASYAALLAKLGDTAEATHELETASAMLPDSGEWTEYVAVHRGHLDLALAREREALGNVFEAERLRALAALRLGSGEGAGEDLRFARRLLARELEALHRVAPAVEDVLVIGKDARWLRFRDGPVVDFGARPLLRGLLLALVRARLAHPGEPLSTDALLQEVGKDERMLARAGLNRLYVALSRLRASGLRDAIEARGDGYLLPPSVQIVMSDEVRPAKPRSTQRPKRARGGAASRSRRARGA
jgi:hypothetical protein